MAKGGEIKCPACGKVSLLIRKPVYDGFTRTGESLSCAACGHAFPSEEELEFTEEEQIQVFTDEDRSRDPQVFEEGEARICRYCRFYVINPFTQWCGHHNREVEATDSCSEFALPEPEKQDPF